MESGLDSRVIPDIEVGDIKTLSELNSLSTIELLNHHTRLMDIKCKPCIDSLKGIQSKRGDTSYHEKYKYCLDGCPYGVQFRLIGESYENPLRRKQKRSSGFYIREEARQKEKDERVKEINRLNFEQPKKKRKKKVKEGQPINDVAVEDKVLVTN